MEKQKLSKVYYSLLHWHDFRMKLFVEGILSGLFAGIIIVAFRFLLEKAESLRAFVYLSFQAGKGELMILWFLGLMSVAYILHWIVTIEPMAGGSGIPQVKGAILGMMKMQWLRILAAKFFGGVLAIGAGLSLGREGPSIQLGAMVGQGISRLLGRTKMEERYLLTSGASAGLSAAFNAPLSGVIFSLEELHKNFSPAVLMSAITAAVTADVVTQQFFGYAPVFRFAKLPDLPAYYFVIVLMVGLTMGILGAVFNVGLLKTLSLYEKQQNWLKGPRKAALPLFTAGLIGFVLPDILGGGNDLVNQLAGTQFNFTILVVLLLGKFFFTMLSYGSGVPGGIFLPMLVLGALGGGLFSQIMVYFGQMDAMYMMNMIVLSMAACFAAVVKAPVTGSVLIMEMTGSFNHLLPLILVSMIAYLVADIGKVKPVYEALLNRSLRAQGKAYTGLNPGKRQVIELVVCMGSQLDKKKVKQINWPHQALLISIKRGEEELLPRGDTRLATGDYLYILAEENQLQALRELAAEGQW
ncbi:hypothetical protein P22_1039 [Propionispora sp. 2/2-37]|uniref:ClC family H(+)/Cl(-) exchange transporter n=1 Tax=Propionispora sp. 2/2-37 TaxID=1677858 RepID=UPI0006BB5DE1|nr:ClC family H(+)/Cl(-) exchange transporter [Propionispora sp. 2/2-37]CUH94970.1 hypothetical protein P22_1039 [Propionispora sp. 2/2-37]